MTERHAMPETIPFADQRVRRAIAFVWHEATLLDDRRYADWEALWADDGRYIMPVDPHTTDFDASPTLVNDDASMRHFRIEQLVGASTPAGAAPRTVRTVSRFSVVEVTEDEVELRSAQLLVGYKQRELVYFAADLTHRIRFEADYPLLVLKAVRLVNSEGEVDPTGFLL